MRVACCQQPLIFAASWPAYAAHVAGQVAEAAAGGAQMLLFAEYAGLSLASLCTPEERADVHHYLPAIQPWLPAYLDLHCALAREHSASQYRSNARLMLAQPSHPWTA